MKWSKNDQMLERLVILLIHQRLSFVPGCSVHDKRVSVDGAYVVNNLNKSSDMKHCLSLGQCYGVRDR